MSRAGAGAGEEWVGAGAGAGAGEEWVGAGAGAGAGEERVEVIVEGLKDVVDKLCKCRFMHPITGNKLGNVALYHEDKVLSGWDVDETGKWSFWNVTNPGEDKRVTTVVDCANRIPVDEAIRAASRMIAKTAVRDILNFEGRNGNILINLPTRRVTIEDSSGTVFVCDEPVSHMQQRQALAVPHISKTIAEFLHGGDEVATESGVLSSSKLRNPLHRKMLWLRDNYRKLRHPHFGMTEHGSFYIEIPQLDSCEIKYLESLDDGANGIFWDKKERELIIKEDCNYEWSEDHKRHIPMEVKYISLGKMMLRENLEKLRSKRGVRLIFVKKGEKEMFENVSFVKFLAECVVDNTDLPGFEPLEHRICVEFKEDNSWGSPRCVKQDQPLYIGRKKALKALEATINERNGKQFSPTAHALSAILSSKGAHAMIEFLRAGARPSVHQDGFYLYIFPKNNRLPPTNPLWKLNETGQEWKQQEFSTDPILLRRKGMYSIGGLHFRIKANCPMN